jgi:flagellin
MIYDENLSAGKSRIRDVDMAAETAELTKQNILTQAGTSVLSQANQNSMLALKLIG